MKEYYCQKLYTSISYFQNEFWSSHKNTNFVRLLLLIYMNMKKGNLQHFKDSIAWNAPMDYTKKI